MGLFLARVGAGLLLVAVSGSDARGQDDRPNGPATQIWANLILGRTANKRTYFELDIEPKWQTSGNDWRSTKLTPLAEYYPTPWIDLQAEIPVTRTHQSDTLDSTEVTPTIGFRLHLFKQAVQARKHERLPLTRVGISTLVRLEWRNLFYSGDIANRHEWRARLRLEGKLAINHATLTQDRTLYAIADIEYFVPLDDDVPERYASKVRTRVGLGYRFSPARRLEFLYVRDWNRKAPQGEATIETQAFDLRFKMLF